MPEAGTLAPVPTGFAASELSLLAPLYPLPRLQLAEGRGARVRDVSGREYVDFVSGIAVNAFGHAPAGLAEVVASQLGTLGQCSNLYAHEPGIALATALTQATGYDRVFFCNSGSESVDGALKFARARAGRHAAPGRDIVAFKGGFHGRTGFALSATYHPSYREPFVPLIPGARFAEFNALSGLDTAIDVNTCAVIVEPVQGENGAVPATREFLQAVRARATAVGAVLVFDEIQTGMGRTGTLLAQEQFGVRGDITVMSKALGAGLPIGAILMTAEVADTLAPGMHGTTFGGNPVCCAAANWALAQVTAPGFLAHARAAGDELARGLAQLAAKHASVREVRGLGLLRAIDLQPAAGFGPPELVAAAREHGLLIIRGGDHAVRVLPPLNVSTTDINDALTKLDASLAALESTAGGSK